jgi:hypothetical protein
MPGPSLLRFIAALIAVVLGQAWRGAQAQTPSVEITTVKDVLALSPEAIAQKPIHVRLHGVVLDVTKDRNDLSLHDGTAAISVTLPEGVTAPDHGTDVTIEGLVIS